MLTSKQTISTFVFNSSFNSSSFSFLLATITKSYPNLDKYLADTPLKGLGKDFIAAQEKYGVNALFLMGIVKTESGYGAAPAKGTKYNLAGLKRAKKYGGGYQKPKSFSESIDDLGSTLKRLYIKSGKITPSKVQKGGYCQGNPGWTKTVVEEWNRINKEIQSYNN